MLKHLAYRHVRLFAQHSSKSGIMKKRVFCTLLLQDNLSIRDQINYTTLQEAIENMTKPYSLVGPDRKSHARITT